MKRVSLTGGRLVRLFMRAEGPDSHPHHPASASPQPASSAGGEASCFIRLKCYRNCNILAEWRGVLVTPAKGRSKADTFKASDLTSRSLQRHLHSAKMLQKLFYPLDHQAKSPSRRSQPANTTVIIQKKSRWALVGVRELPPGGRAPTSTDFPETLWKSLFSKRRDPDMWRLWRLVYLGSLLGEGRISRFGGAHPERTEDTGYRLSY